MRVIVFIFIFLLISALIIFFKYETGELISCNSYSNPSMQSEDEIEELESLSNYLDEQKLFIVHSGSFMNQPIKIDSQGNKGMFGKWTPSFELKFVTRDSGVYSHSKPKVIIDYIKDKKGNDIYNDEKSTHIGVTGTAWRNNDDYTDKQINNGMFEWYDYMSFINKVYMKEGYTTSDIAEVSGYLNFLYLLNVHDLGDVKTIRLSIDEYADKVYNDKNASIFIKKLSISNKIGLSIRSSFKKNYIVKLYNKDGRQINNKYELLRRECSDKWDVFIYHLGDKDRVEYLEILFPRFIEGKFKFKFNDIYSIIEPTL